ncbi:MAG: sulfatase-like hydrolase/transferase [Lachnospiraceae bacterium]|nr:sulfatase-like hydrolase/transferase [Lachnospiraceae bacterium]
MNIKIEQLITDGKYKQAWEQICQYEKMQPLDSDIDTYKFLCSYGIGDMQSALEFARFAVKKQPYVADAHYNCGCAYQACEKYFEAYEQYAIARELAIGGNPIHVDFEELDAEMQRILNIVMDYVENENILEMKQAREWVDYLLVQDKFQWGVRKPIFHDSGCDMLLKEYRDYPYLPKMYLGIAGLQSVYRFWMNGLRNNTVEEEIDMQRILEESNYFEMESDKECFLPILMDHIGILEVKTEEKKADISYTSPFQYVNYRIPRGKTIVSTREGKFKIGEVVPIVHDKKRKSLVLNIFVDGLSQTVLDSQMKELMPHTYRFFKKGMICTNVHTAGDWTFPSIASIMTGQTMATHRMLHSKLLRKIDLDTPILYEYFKNAGYNTTKIGGNWRIAPNYGYARGMNRVHYQHMYHGLSIEKVVSEVQEQMHIMRETDQFIWMEIGELHLVSDEIYNAPFQPQFMIWQNDELKGKINSVKQEYDETKKKYYLKQIEYIDRKLAGLYQYIEENYKDDEIVVSLFADHGQGFLVPSGEPFLCDERTKIAFMTRGGRISGSTNELISACDYTPIMCKLAGLDYDFENTDAILPQVYGGKTGREFVLTESIHVGDPYQIVLNGKDFQFYLKGKENVTSECRVPLDEYEVKLADREGNDIQDEERIAYYTRWCLEHIGECRIYNN